MLLIGLGLDWTGLGFIVVFCGCLVYLIIICCFMFDFGISAGWDVVRWSLFAVWWVWFLVLLGVCWISLCVLA